MNAPFECELASGVDAPGAARRLLTQWFGAVLAEGTLTTARLLVSELVTNAVKHGRGRITVRAQLVGLRLRVEVIDEGDGFEFALRKRDVRVAGVGGWGLSVVDEESNRWGVRRDK